MWSKPVKAALLVTALLLLLPCAALAESVDLPAERLVLKDWLSPFGYSKCDNCNTPNFQTFSIGSAKITAQNMNSLPSHIYYRMLVYPNGTEQVVDQYYFRGNESAGSAPEKLKPPSQGGTYSPDTVTHYYNNRTLPAITIDVGEPGNYRLDIRHIEIPAPTVANYLKTRSDDRKLTKDSVVDVYYSNVLLIFQRDYYSGRYPTHYNDRTYYPESVCNGPSWFETVTSYTNYPYGDVTSHFDQYCYSLYLRARAVKLSAAAKTEKTYQFTVEEPPIAPPQPPSNEITGGATVGSESSPFVTGAGDQKAKPANGGMAVAMLAGMGGVAAIGTSYALAKTSGRPKLTVVNDNLQNYARNFAAELEDSISESVNRLKSELKATEKWAADLIEKDKKAEEDEKRRRMESESGGGIPLKKVGNSYVRADTGAYWSTASSVPVFGNGWSYSGGNVTAKPPWVEPVVVTGTFNSVLGCGGPDDRHDVPDAAYPQPQPEPHPLPPGKPNTILSYGPWQADGLGAAGGAVGIVDELGKAGVLTGNIVKNIPFLNTPLALAAAAKDMKENLVEVYDDTGDGSKAFVVEVTTGVVSFGMNFIGLDNIATAGKALTYGVPALINLGNGEPEKNGDITNRMLRDEREGAGWDNLSPKDIGKHVGNLVYNAPSALASVAITILDPLNPFRSRREERLDL